MSMQGVGVDVIKNGSERLTIVEKKVPEFDSMIQGRTFAVGENVRGTEIQMYRHW